MLIGVEVDAAPQGPRLHPCSTLGAGMSRHLESSKGKLFWSTHSPGVRTYYGRSYRAG